MAKGYPEPPPQDDAAELSLIDEMIGENTCIICKKRPRETRGMCGTCYGALHPGEG